MKVYIIEDGYDYECSGVESVYAKREDAEKDILEWKESEKKDYDIPDEDFEKLPNGLKHGSNYRIILEREVKG